MYTIIKVRYKVGEKVGFWTVIDPEVRNSKNERCVLCRCICGKERLIKVIDLHSGTTHSCGCKRSITFGENQRKAKKRGQEIMEKIREANAVAGLTRKVNKNSTTKHTGVSFSEKYGIYRAYIYLHRKQINLGSFSTLEDAIAARKAAEEKYLGKYRKIVENIKKNT